MYISHAFTLYGIIYFILFYNYLKKNIVKCMLYTEFRYYFLISSFAII